MNLVREHINFQRGLDPKVAMDIGNMYWGEMGTAGLNMDAGDINRILVLKPYLSLKA